jgi:thiol-disulfide isomerase/thioredoxin
MNRKKCLLRLFSFLVFSNIWFSAHSVHAETEQVSNTQSRNILSDSKLLKPIGSNEAIAELIKQQEYTMLDMWASWCEPCKASLPFYYELESKYNGRLRLVAVSQDDSFKEATDFINENKLNGLFFWDEKKKLSSYLKLEAIPMLYIIDKNGNVIAEFRGFTKKKKAILEDKLAELLPTKK